MMALPTLLPRLTLPLMPAPALPPVEPVAPPSAQPAPAPPLPSFDALLAALPAPAPPATPVATLQAAPAPPAVESQLAAEAHPLPAILATLPAPLRLPPVSDAAHPATIEPDVEDPVTDAPPSAPLTLPHLPTVVPPPAAPARPAPALVDPGEPDLSPRATAARLNAKAPPRLTLLDAVKQTVEQIPTQRPLEQAIAPAPFAPVLAQAGPQPTASPAPVLDFAQVERWVAELDREIGQLAERGGGQLRFALTPERLGPVDVAVRHDAGLVHVEFTTSSPEVRQVLDELKPQLNDQLRGHGLSLAADQQGRQHRQQQLAQGLQHPLIETAAREDGDSPQRAVTGRFA